MFNDISFTDIFLVPVFNIIAISSSLDKLETPYLINLSLGLSSFGISFINNLWIIYIM